MTHKAFNGRVIVEFLADACEMVVSRQLPDGDNRIFGQWLTAKIAQGNREWPYPLDPEFGLATTCLLLDCIALFKKIFHAFLKLIFACWKDNNLVVATSYEYNLRCRNQIWHANLRKSIARWFNLCERNGRYLWLFWVLVCDTVIYISFFCSVVGVWSQDTVCKILLNRVRFICEFLWGQLKPQMIWCPVACCSAKHICFWLPYRWGQGIEHSCVCCVSKYMRSRSNLKYPCAGGCNRTVQEIATDAQSLSSGSSNPSTITSTTSCWTQFGIEKIPVTRTALLMRMLWGG